MRSILSLVIPSFVAATSLQAAEPNTLLPTEEKSGWQLLFDGSSLEHFRGYGRDDVPEGWVVEDGAIVFRPVDGVAHSGDLMTKSQYQEFELSLEYKISKSGNSGVMFHVVEQDGKPSWYSGPEVQVQDNVDGHDPQLSGWLYQLYQPPKTIPIAKAAIPGSDPDTPLDATRPAGEWNQIHLRLSNDQCELNLNGVRYYQFVLGSDDWKEKVAASKFAQFAGFGEAGAGHFVLQDHGDEVAYRNIKVRPLHAETPADDPVDGLLAVKPAKAFPKLQWENWQSFDDEKGKLNTFIPVLIENAGDGSDRLFVVDQRGVIYVFNNDPDVEQATVFLDIHEQVQNRPWVGDEQGLLGLAFHPHFGEQGHPAARDFYIYYTLKADGKTSVISRFRVSEDDPNKARRDSEEVIFTAEQPFGNHNGGTIAFGNDGYLYIAFGDGGAFYDPYNNAQNLATPLGSVLRIDVDKPSDGKLYGIPEDNPFVGRTAVNGEPAMSEIYAYGLRNPWRLTNDPESGRMWIADVGQNLWEEIDILERGGNYGWNFLEASATFGGRLPTENGVQPSDLIPPVWEYDHQIGRSITGGMVYRGAAAPDLVGLYIYGDYVSGKLFALQYDPESKTVTSNMGIQSDDLPIFTFGRDEAGEVYFGAPDAKGNGIYKFVPTE